MGRASAKSKSSPKRIAQPQVVQRTALFKQAAVNNRDESVGGAAAGQRPFAQPGHVFVTLQQLPDGGATFVLTDKETVHDNTTKRYHPWNTFSSKFTQLMINACL